MLTSVLRDLFKEFIKGYHVLQIQVKHLAQIEYTIFYEKVNSFDSLNNTVNALVRIFIYYK